MEERPAASSVKEGRRQEIVAVLELVPFFWRLGGGWWAVGGGGRLAWVVGQREAGAGAACPALGLRPQHALSSAPAGTDPFPLACHFASQETCRLRFYFCCCLQLELCVGGSREGQESLEEARREERAVLGG